MIGVRGEGRKLTAFKASIIIISDQLVATSHEEIQQEFKNAYQLLESEMETNNMSNSHADIKTIGEFPIVEAIKKLKEVGETDAAESLENSLSNSHLQDIVSSQIDNLLRVAFRWPFNNRPWQHTSHAFGYIATKFKSADELDISQMGAHNPDVSLINTPWIQC